MKEFNAATTISLAKYCFYINEWPSGLSTAGGDYSITTPPPTPATKKKKSYIVHKCNFSIVNEKSDVNNSFLSNFMHLRSCAVPKQ